jgi:hypothetical protein
MFVYNNKAVDFNARPKKVRKSGAKGDFSVFLKDEEDEQAAVNGVISTPTVSSALFLQDVSNQDDIKERSQQRGNKILDSLEDYEKDLLKGKDPKKSLDNLSSQLSSQRLKSNDPMLESLIDEVELRAAVEAAKREQKE